MIASTATLSGIRRPVTLDLAGGLSGRASARRSLAFARDFAALAGLFGVLYGWFWVGAALTA